MSGELSADEKLEIVNKYCSLKFPDDFEPLGFRFLEKYEIWLVCPEELLEVDLERIADSLPGFQKKYPGKTKEDALAFWENMMENEGKDGFSWKIESYEAMKLFLEIAGKEKA